MIQNNAKPLKNRLFAILGIVFIIFTSILISYEIFHQKKDIKDHIKLKNEQIIKATNSFLEFLKTDVSKKIDILLSNENISKAFFEKDRDLLYNYTKDHFKRQSFLNPYLKIMTFRLTDGSAFLRVHKPQMYGDKLNQKRTIILDTNRLKKRHYGFEVGKLKMTYRVVTPIFHKGEHIGLVEIGIEPEYLIKKLNAAFENIKNGLLVKYADLDIHLKKIKDTITIDSFVLARGDEIFKKNRKKISLKQNQQNIIVNYDNSDFTIATNLNLYNHKNEIAAKILFAYEVRNFKEHLFKVLTITIVTIVFLMLILFFILNFIYRYFLGQLEKKAQIIENQKNEIKTILNASSNIVVVSDGRKILDANYAFLEFFDDFKDLDHFRKKYNCVCDRFEKFDQEGYLYEKEIDGLTWADYIIAHKENNFKVVLKKNDVPYHFLIKANKIRLDNNDYIVANLNDITSEITQQKEIELQNKIIAEQSKMAALGEMLGNISHQWRQPLSAISVSVSGLKLQKELGVLDDAAFNDAVKMVVENTQYLSNTIDDFKNFIIGDKSKSKFKLKEIFDKTLRLMQASIRNHHLIIIKDFEKEINLNSYPNELIQCLTNIINNAKDVLDNIDEQNRYIFITTSIEDNKASIKIKDSAGGIENSIIDKIFEPYFTTKHQALGTGLGLYMTHKIITESLKGSISVRNVDFEYNSQQYKGAEFTIMLPLS